MVYSSVPQVKEYGKFLFSYHYLKKAIDILYRIESNKLKNINPHDDTKIVFKKKFLDAFHSN
jgi:hypothetical protein